MKKIVLILTAGMIAASAFAQNAQEQKADKFFLNHLAVGVSAGTDAVGLEAALPVGKHLTVRGGYNFLPFDLKFTQNVKLPTDPNDLGGSTSSVELQEKFNFGDAKLLLDIYPSSKHGFHLTVGAYYGQDWFFQVNNNTELDPRWTGSGIALKEGDGDYLFGPDENGQLKAGINPGKLRPYVGLGFGRAIKKSRLSFTFDLGAIYWGKNVAQAHSYFAAADEWKGIPVTGADLGDWEEGKIIADIVDGVQKNLVIWPVLNFHLYLRLF